MPPSGLIWRILIAVLVVVVVLAILPPFFRVVGFPIEGDLWLIVRICVAALAVFYVVTGRPTVS